MYIFIFIVAILLLIALVVWLIRRAGRSDRSGRREDGSYDPTGSYIIIGGTSESSSETGSGFNGGDIGSSSGESDFGGGGSGGDFGDSGGGGGDSGGGDGGGGGE